MKYGDLPKSLGMYKIKCQEMMFYQYLPIKLIHTSIRIEERLNCFNDLIILSINDYVNKYGLEKYNNSYVYLTAKYMFQTTGCSFNREGYHSDGFLTNDINYIWCDKNPTIFNNSIFNLTLDDNISMLEMNNQALTENEIVYSENELLRLNQYNIHKVADVINPGMRTFVKISISKDKYDLIGNSHNYEFDYDWTMKQRQIKRNIPQSNINI